MPKQKIEIEVDVPEGKEIRCHCLSGNERRDGELTAVLYTVSFQDAWQWPSWLICPWIAMDENGSWWAYANEPTQFSDNWEGAKSHCLSPAWMVDFQPPPCTDWRQSKRRRPE